MTPSPVDKDVLTRIDGSVGFITLNRPKALHALTEAMCHKIAQTLGAWRDAPEISLIILDHAGDRGFCAGGDIRTLTASGFSDGAAAASFFRTEYRLNHLMFTYPKPIVAFMDGLVMGGGVGVSLPCRYRVATERTAFAMPETGIGLFPDVGGGWYLPRLPQRAGFWLGLTGARLKAADCAALGLTTHFVESGQALALKGALCERPAAASEVLKGFAATAGDGDLSAHLPEIETAFADGAIQDVVDRLHAGSAWAQSQAAALLAKSPQAVKVTWEQLRRGLNSGTFAEVLAMEFRLATRIVRRHDFLQGVRAVIVAKDNDPRWFPTTLADVPDAVIQALFAPLSPDDEWTPMDFPT